MKRFFFIGALAMGGWSVAAAPLQVITTTTDLKSLVEIVGGNRVQVSSIARGVQDVHTVEAKPSFMVRLQSADQVFAQGLELETAWLEPLILGARNSKLKMGTRSVLELGLSLDPIEVAKGDVSRAQGDVHPQGNPHYQLDPVRMGLAAELIAQRLSELDVAGRETYLKNAANYKLLLLEKNKDWKKRIDAAGIKELITYHKTFAYFCDRFRIKCELQLEPKPGIPPTTSHLVEVLKQAKERNLKLVLIENYFDLESGNKLKAQNSQLRVVSAPVSVEGEPDLHRTEDVIERLVKTLEVKTNAKP